MGEGTFWSRVGRMLRTGRRSTERRDLPAIGDDGLLADGPPSESGEYEAVAASTEKPLLRWSRRDQVLQQLQEGYQRVAELIDAMQRHQVEQGNRTERIAVSLDHLARTMSDLPAASREQSKTLNSIASHLEVTNFRTQQLAESISELPGATKAQSEVLARMSRQFEMTGETNVHLRHALDALSRAVDSLRDSGQMQAELLRRFQLEGQQREGRLADLIAQQQGRFTLLFVVALVFAMIGAAGTIVLLLRVLR